MRKAFILFLLIAVVSATYSSTNTVPGSSKNPSIKATEVYVPVGKNGQLISLMELSEISVKDYENLSGKKMKFREKVTFKMKQRELKKNINYDGTFSKKKVEKYFNKAALGGAFSLSGLALGLFLSLIGVLIAYLITKGDKKGRVTWAWIGAAIGFIIWGAVLI
ncbi:MAG TPA: hypothetical protein VIU35_18080 [Chitinophagaceae bacterium]